MKYLKDVMKFKDEYKQMQFMYLHPAICLIAVDMAFYFACHGHEFVITSAIRSKADNFAAGARSTTHLFEDGARAIDVRTGHLPEIFIRKAIAHFSEKYAEVAALVVRNGELKKSLIVYGDENHLDHMHIQVKRDIPNNYPLGGK
jgi:hypothetical protein